MTTKEQSVIFLRWLAILSFVATMGAVYYYTMDTSHSFFVKFMLAFIGGGMVSSILTSTYLIFCTLRGDFSGDS